jgi:TolA-binding protein
MKKYFVLLISSMLIISCSKTTDQDYLTQAQKSLSENKVDQAIKSIESLLSDYPDSKLAPKALSQLASIYQNQLVKNINPNESFRLAQKYFTEVYEKYPTSEEAPKSLFLCGFILSNNLRNYDEATTHYKLFLSKYPDHPLAVSAQEELDNMGLTPEEILKRTETAKK